MGWLPHPVCGPLALCASSSQGGLPALAVSMPESWERWCRTFAEEGKGEALNSLVFLNRDLTLLLLAISVPFEQGPDGHVLAIALELIGSGFIVMRAGSANKNATIDR